MASEIIQRITTGLIFVTFLFVPLLLLPPLYFSLLLGALFLGILAFEWPRLCPRSLIGFLLTLCYLIIPFFLLFAMNQTPQDHQALIFLFLLLFGHDTGAYCAGKVWGKHFLAKKISPQKTWEGFLGGFCMVLLLLFLVKKQCSTQLISWQLPFLALLLSISATLGDLFESFLKRRAGVKDASSLLPGHGGLLDRFDSILCATPFFYLIRAWFR